jgi:hypothetical protein
MSNFWRGKTNDTPADADTKTKDITDITPPDKEPFSKIRKSMGF